MKAEPYPTEAPDATSMPDRNALDIPPSNAVELGEALLSGDGTVPAILDQFPTGVMVCDPTGQMVYQNAAAQSIWGGRAELRGVSDWGVYRAYHADGEPFQPEDWALYRCLAHREVVTSEEVHFRRFDGEHGVLLCNAAPIVDSEDHLVGAVAVFSDLTALKQDQSSGRATAKTEAAVSSALERRVREYAAADEAKTTFLATTTHELKSPIAVIKGFAELLQASKGADTALVDQAVTTILSRANELSAIVDRLLESSRIMAGQTAVKIEEVDVAAIVAARARDCAVSKARTIKLDIPKGLPLGRADATAFVTVIDHILDNAVKYSPSGMAIGVRMRDEGGRITTDVTDHGIGMTPEQASRCFQKFWQGESAGDRRFGGAGIGLFIVRSLMEAMGGEVRVSSRPGHGSTFSLSVPAVRESASGNVDRSRRAGFGERSSIREVMRQFGVPMGSDS